MESFENRFEKAMIDRLQKAIGDRIDVVISGHLKFEEYVAQCEAIRTLQDTLQSISDIRYALAKEATGREPNPVMQRMKR